MSDLPQPASAELIALAVRARPDWGSGAVHDVLAQARNADMSWPRVLVAMAQLIADPDAEPPDLLASAPEAWRYRRPPAPETAHRGAAAVRAALHTEPDSD
ncbi:hypothetical protein [Streptomyces umbrinus]|uniref:hypothetical protein n=1 Tax=Streptomyces umbrinus TaxID=67370 RepID=UPI003444CF84